MKYIKRKELEAKSLECFGVKSRYHTLMRRYNVTAEQMEAEMDLLNELRKQIQERENGREQSDTDGSNQGGSEQTPDGTVAAVGVDGSIEGADVRGEEVRPPQLETGDGVVQTDGGGPEAHSGMDGQGES